MTDCASFIKFCTDHGNDAAVDVLERICDAAHVKDRPPGIRFSEVHRHDAINYTYAGEVDCCGSTFGFVIDNGNWNGTVVCEWGDPEKVGDYEPPEPTRFMFVPVTPNLKEDSPALWSVYLAWTKTDWFQEKLRGYHYDRHFQPGEAIERHYRDWAAQKGMKIVVADGSP